MKVLIIDNYDSFTYNLYQYLGEILEDRHDSFRLDVIRNDEWSYEQIVEGFYNHVVVSPGPGHPGDPDYFGISAKVLTELSKTTPVLGVCLGMQGIAHYYGGSVIRAKLPMHGKVSRIEHSATGVFEGIQSGIEVMRYHSLIVDPENLPDDLEVTATAEIPGTHGELEIMGIRHKKRPWLEGIQFHPESFATDHGLKMLSNFLSIEAQTS